METFNKIFEINETLSPKFINNKDDYYLVELQESKTEMLNLNSKGLKTKITNQIKLKIGKGKLQIEKCKLKIAN